MLTGDRVGCSDASKTQHYTSYTSDAVTGLAGRVTQAHETWGMERPKALTWCTQLTWRLWSFHLL